MKITRMNTSPLWWRDTMKRIVDMTGSTIFLILFMPLLLVISIFIKLTSEGPVILRGKGIGRHGQEFDFLIFRTVGHAGAFIRRCSLDQLPLLLNVLRGEMSLVGPELSGYVKSTIFIPEQADTVVDKRIIRPPGSHLRAVVEFFYSPRTVARVFNPILADMQYEWMDAVGLKQPWKARWVRIRGYWHFWQSIGLQTLIGAIRKMLLIWKVGS